MTDPVRFTGDARPYQGGDPYADYRSAELPFIHLPDLTDRRLGAGVVAAGDEFFAERENLLRRERPAFDPRLFGHKGKIMDGWETRRRRGTGADAPHPADGDHDWALVRLGVPGVVRGVLVDTAHFRGNHPRAVSVDAACVPGTPSPEELQDAEWTRIVPETEIGGHAANGFTVDCGRRFTHLRLNQHPDGGIARLRVYGDVVPEPAWLTALGTFDVVALENGGRVLDASDRFYSPPEHTILPGRSRQMNDGWETRRRRDSGHDWISYALTAQATVRAVEIDTACLKGNAAGWAALWGRDGDPEDGAGGSGTDGGKGGAAGDGKSGETDSGKDGAQDTDTPDGWREILPRTRLEPDTLHRFRLPDGVGPLTQVRLGIFPDGGISRLRLHGSLTPEGEKELRERYARTTAAE